MNEPVNFLLVFLSDSKKLTISATEEVYPDYLSERLIVKSNVFLYARGLEQFFTTNCKKHAWGSWKDGLQRFCSFGRSIEKHKQNSRSWMSSTIELTAEWPSSGTLIRS